MNTLLLRLTAPLQAWGVEVRYDVCSTRREPTKSGVLGLAAAALGIPRDDDAAIEPLRGLKFGIRVDREGTILRDFHMVRAERSSYVTQRYYLSDALFLAGLEGEDELLSRIAAALSSPVFPLFLGRRSCPPEGPIVLGIRAVPLEEALRAEPWLQPEWRRKRVAPTLRMVLDSDEPGAAIQRDLPVSFDPRQRAYIFRGVRETSVTLADFLPAHDPMAELEVLG